MRYDLFGQETSLDTAATLEEWNATQLAFLAHGASTPKHLAAVLTAEPGFALGQAVKGLFMMLLGRREMLDTAAEALAAAQTAVAQGQVTTRERAFVEALAVWMTGRPSGAIARLDAVLDRHPDDVLAMKLAHAIRFVMGDGVGMLASIEQVLPAYAPDHAGRGYLLGCHAFALEENGAYDRAEIAGRQALWMAPDDAWGLHAVAHVHDMTCNSRAGLEWLTGREAAWAHCNNFRYHVWWHKALMHLDQGQVGEVIALYDAQIRQEKTDDYRDISNATSLLARLELEGIDVGDRWDELADVCATRTDDGSLIFADLHYLLALTATGDQDGTQRLIARIARDAQHQETEAQERMAQPGLAAARGLEAFGDGAYDRAFGDLLAARGQMQQAGGSHAQRDVFERITIDAGLRAGRLDDVSKLLDDRRTLRAGRDDQFSQVRRDLIEATRRLDRSGPVTVQMPAQ